jgi:autotransporter-associated beta strand protein
LKLSTAGTSAINAALDARSVYTTGGGPVTIGAAVHTKNTDLPLPGTNTLGQEYHSSTTLATGAALTADGPAYNADIKFFGPVLLTASSVAMQAEHYVIFNEVLNGSSALSVNSQDSQFYAPVGSGTALTSLAATGLSTLGGNGVVKTTGNQTYPNGIATVTDETLRSTGGTVSIGTQLLNSNVTSNVVLDGTAVFQPGTVVGSAVAPLTTLHVMGTLSMGATSVTTTGAQDYDGAVTLTAAPILKTTDNLVTFGSTVDGAYALGVQTSNVKFNDAVGFTTKLTSVTVDTGKTTTVGAAGPFVATTGSQSYGHMTLTNGAALQSDSASIGVAGNVALANHELEIAGGGTFAGVISGTGGWVSFLGPGTLVLSGANTYDAGTAVSGAGTLLVNGAVGHVDVSSAGTLGGTGTVGDVIIHLGTLGPGASPGMLSATGPVALQSNSTFKAELNGTTAGSGYDQLAMTGTLPADTVTLGGAALSLSASTFPHVGQVFRIIDNSGTDAVIGTFGGLPEGSVIHADGALLQLTYVGGTGNDVTLTPLKQATTTTASSSPASVTEGSRITLSATVAGPAGAAKPTGMVTFSEGGTTLGSASLSNGTASLPTSALTAGQHPITATYAGDVDFDGSSGSLALTIGPKPLPEPSQLAPTGPSGPTGASGASPTVSVADAKGKETDPVKKSAAKAKPLVFVVTLSRAAAAGITVSYSTKAGTAKSGKDFKRKAGKLTFAPGKTKLKVVVPLVADNRKEKSEKFTLRLSGPVGAVLKRAVATGTIRDDD